MNRIWHTFPFTTPLVLAYRNMRQRITRTLLTFAGIALGVAVILAVSITNATTLDAFRQVFDETSGKAQINITAAQAERRPLKNRMVTQVRRQPGVIAAAPSLTASSFLAEDVGKWQPSVSIGGLGGNLLVFGVDSEVDRKVRSYEVKEGRWLSGSRFETVIPADYARQKGLGVGNELVIFTPGGTQSFKIVGLLSNTGASMMNGGSVAFMPLGAVQEAFLQGSELTAIDIILEPEIAGRPQELEETRLALQEVLGSDYRVQYPAARGQVVSQMLSVYQGGLSFFSVMAMFIGAFLIYNTFSMTVLERTSEIGMLRTVGMARFQVLAMVLAEAFLLGVSGTLAGIFCGVLLGRGLISLQGGLLKVQISSYSIPYDGLLLSVGVGLGVTLFSALIPSVQAARISPLTALRKLQSETGSGLSWLWVPGVGLCLLAYLVLYQVPLSEEFALTTGSLGMLALLLGVTFFIPGLTSVLERWLRPAMTLVYKTAGDLGTRNLQRAPGRTTLTVAALMIGIILIVGIGSVTNSFETDLDNWSKTSIGGDLQVVSPTPLRPEFSRNLSSIQGVQAVTGRSIYEVRLTASDAGLDDPGGDRLRFNAIDPVTFLEVGSLTFTQPENVASKVLWDRFTQGGGLFVSTGVADRYHLVPGDMLTLLTARGEQPFEILAVVVDFNPQGSSIFGTRQDAAESFGQTRINRFTIRVKEGYPISEVRQEIEDSYQQRYNLVVASSKEYEQRVDLLTQQAFSLLDVLSLIGMLIGALGVVNTLMMSVLERQREIGGLRSLGMQRRQVQELILAEASSLGVLGAIFGLSFGTIISAVMVNVLNTLGSYALDLTLPVGPFLIGLAIALGVAQLAALYPARMASSVNILEAIRSE